MWHDSTKFKNLSTVSPREQAILSAFGGAVARAMLQQLDAFMDLRGRSALELRAALLQGSAVVGAGELVTFCWSVGLPLAQLRIRPLASKRMHAMTASVGPRGAMLLGVEHRYLARYAFVIAHEIAHVALGHLPPNETLMDVEDPLLAVGSDAEERAADAYALTLLTGTPEPAIQVDVANFSATQLARAASHTGPGLGIDPAVLALTVGHRYQRWAPAMGAVKILSGDADPAWRTINRLAAQQLDLVGASYATREYLRPLLGVDL